MSENKNFHIQVTTEDGQKLFWHKGGKRHELPPELADIWVSKFKPEIWQINAQGEMVGVGRSTEPTFKIVKVEKVAV